MYTFHFAFILYRFAFTSFTHSFCALNTRNTWHLRPCVRALVNVFNFTNVSTFKFSSFSIFPSCPHIVMSSMPRHLIWYLAHTRAYRFAIELIESNQERVKAAIILKEKLDYNEQMIYHLILTATVSIESGN